MYEKKVATKQERLLFEKLIRDDMQRPRQRELLPQTPQQDPREMYMARTPLQQYPLSQPSNANPNDNRNQEIKKIPKQPRIFNIKRNIGKRDMIWEEKRRIKWSQKNIAPQRQTPQYNNNYQQSSNNYYNNDMRNAPLKSPSPQQNGYTQNNQPQRTPMNYYDQPTRTPLNNYPNPSQTSTPMGYPNQDRRTPMQQQQQQMRTPMNNYQNYPQQQMRTPMNQNTQPTPNSQRMQTNSRGGYYPQGTPMNNPNSYRQNSSQNYYGQRAQTEGNYYQRATPSQGNYPPTPGSGQYQYANQYQQPQYGNGTPAMTPYQQQRSPQYPQNQNINPNMRGSRTPFADYNPKGGFYQGQQTPIQIPNRPPSRPFGNMSFKNY